MINHQLERFYDRICHKDWLTNQLFDVLDINLIIRRTLYNMEKIRKFTAPNPYELQKSQDDKFINEIGIVFNMHTFNKVYIGELFHICMKFDEMDDEVKNILYNYYDIKNAMRSHCMSIDFISSGINPYQIAHDLNARYVNIDNTRYYLN